MNVTYLVQAGQDGPVRVDACLYAKLEKTLTALQAGSPELLTIRALHVGGAETLSLIRPTIAPHLIRERWYSAEILGLVIDVPPMPFDEASERRRLARLQLREIRSAA